MLEIEVQFQLFPKFTFDCRKCTFVEVHFWEVHFCLITTVKKRFFLEMFANEELCIVSRLPLNVTSQETSICRLFEKL